MTDERKPNPQTQLTLEEHLADKTPIIQRIDDARFNIGYVALDIAKEAGLGVTLKSYQILKKIIDEAKKWIDTKPEYDRFDGFRKFKAIDGIIKEAGFRVKHGDGERFIKEGFETDEISCLPPVLIYLSVAEALGLPIRAVNTPRHISVIWEPFGERSFYWDPTMAEDCGVEVTKEQYIEMFNLEPKHIAEGLLLNVLDRKQVLARVFNNRGIARQDTDITGALHDFQESARLDPNYADVYPGIAGIYLLKGDYDKALENSERAVALNPTLSTAFMLRGFCYAVKKKSAGALLHAGAVLDIYKAINLADNNPMDKTRGIVEQAYAMLSTIYSMHGDFSNAILALTDAIKINPKFADAYKARAELYQEIALRNMEEHDRLVKSGEAVQFDHITIKLPK